MLNATTNMTFETAAAASLALKPDAPLFCFSAPQLQARAQIFLKGFPGEVTFAVKANSSSQVIKGLADAGVKAWDVASVHEMAMVSKIVPNARFHYHNPGQVAPRDRRRLQGSQMPALCRGLPRGAGKNCRYHRPRERYRNRRALCAAPRTRLIGP